MFLCHMRWESTNLYGTYFVPASEMRRQLGIGVENARQKKTVILKPIEYRKKSNSQCRGDRFLVRWDDDGGVTMPKILDLILAA